MFKSQNAEQKQKLVRLITSNCVANDGKFDLQMKSPFDQIMKSGKSGKWLPTIAPLRTFNWKRIQQDLAFLMTRAS
jgi:hypothetical protein